MKIIVTGAAGFIANKLISSLLSSGHEIIGIDNFSRGTPDNLKYFLECDNFSFHEIDFSEKDALEHSFESIEIGEVDEVWHFAANSDIAAGVNNPELDLKDTFLTTFYILEFMKLKEIKDFYFASSAAVYGDHQDNLLVESQSVTRPISNYGSMKLASESIIYASYESFLNKALIFRFPNVVGTPATHGVIYDLFHKIKKTSNKLNVLGDGTQTKSYLLVDELVNVMLELKLKSNKIIDIFNIGPNDDEGASVRYISEKIVSKFKPCPEITYGASNKGWVGDVPKFKYSIEKIKKLGCTTQYNSKEAIDTAVDQIYNQIFHDD